MLNLSKLLSFILIALSMVMMTGCLPSVGGEDSNSGSTVQSNAAINASTASGTGSTVIADPIPNLDPTAEPVDPPITQPGPVDPVDPIDPNNPQLIDQLKVRLGQLENRIDKSFFSNSLALYRSCNGFGFIPEGYAFYGAITPQGSGQISGGGFQGTIAGEPINPVQPEPMIDRSEFEEQQNLLFEKIKGVVNKRHELLKNFNEAVKEKYGDDDFKELKYYACIFKRAYMHSFTNELGRLDDEDGFIQAKILAAINNRKMARTALRILRNFLYNDNGEFYQNYVSVCEAYAKSYYELTDELYGQLPRIGALPLNKPIDEDKTATIYGLRDKFQLACSPEIMLRHVVTYYHSYQVQTENE